MTRRLHTSFRLGVFALVLALIGMASRALGRGHVLAEAAPAAPRIVQASAPARTCGVPTFRIEAVGRRFVRASWEGGDIAASGDSDRTLQRLALEERSFALETTSSRVVLRRLDPSATDLLVAETDDAMPTTGHGRRWRTLVMTEEAASVLHLIAALDVDLAVQGSSLVYGARAHASCTLECLRATACTERVPIADGCIDALDLCGACMIPAP